MAILRIAHLPNACPSSAHQTVTHLLLTSHGMQTKQLPTIGTRFLHITTSPPDCTTRRHMHIVAGFMPVCVIVQAVRQAGCLLPQDSSKLYATYSH